MAVKTTPLITDPALHESNDAKGLVHRFTTVAGSEEGTGSLGTGLAFEKEFRREFILLERAGWGARYCWRGALRELASVGPRE